MGFEEPYHYHQPTTQSGADPFNHGFDPKAYTRASFLPPTTPRSRRSGPMLDFNRHPDSYLSLPYGQTNAVPMGRNTKRNVRAMRWVQLSLRVMNMLVALGMLVCVICVTNVAGTEGWVIRLAVWIIDNHKCER